MSYPALLLILACGLLLTAIACGFTSLAEGHLNAGKRLQDEGRFDQAIEESAAAILLDPEYAKPTPGAATPTR